MPRHDGARYFGGRHHAPGSKGKGHRGRKVMKTRREASGMDKATFEAMLSRLGIQGRRA